jgi:hypothetical protein
VVRNHQLQQEQLLEGESLPSCRTFLLRFSSTAQPQVGICRGRIEHIPTGRTVRFSSQENIDDFVQEMLTAENGQQPTDN